MSDTESLSSRLIRSGPNAGRVRAPAPMSDTVPQASALKLAILFHETYERLAPSFGYETRADTKTFDPESKNGRLMVAVCGEIASQPPAAIEASDRERWNADNPGEMCLHTFDDERPSGAEPEQEQTKGTT